MTSLMTGCLVVAGCLLVDGCMVLSSLSRVDGNWALEICWSLVVSRCKFYIPLNCY